MRSMATYFHGNSEIQAGGDGLQTLILMNPAYAGYADTQHQLPPPGGGNFAFLSPNSAGNTTINISQAHHFAGVQSPASAASTRDSHHQDVQEFHGFLPVIDQTGELMPKHRVHYNPAVEIGEAREFTSYQQGLSLSLSSQQPTGYGSFRPPEREAPPLVTASPLPVGEEIRASTSMIGVQNAVLGSKYLKVAQELLDEVVRVGKEPLNANEKSIKGENEHPNNIGESSAAGDGQSGGGDSNAKRGAELTTAEKHEIQMKKAKLVNMLDEVEQRYKQYNNQIQIIISLFEQVAGINSAKTYTSLALKTISKQFRCLKDSILAQIRAATKSLGEEDHGSRLKYVDNQIRQQKALQQLGMIQQNAWRPQRGLPERSVSVLRAWLFEHFLHPYPKDSDKIMLAKQAGLTRSQVSNWFINARVRLWKPMVEEMYEEEVKEQEKTGGEDNTTQTEPITQQSPKKPRNMEQTPTNVENMIKFGPDNGGGDGFTLMGAPTNFIGGFGSNPVGELGSGQQFGTPYSGNGVSLTLGLPHDQTFLPNESIQLGREVEIRETNDGFSSMIG